MSSFQRIVKYVGIGFALLLTVVIIGGVTTVVFGITGSKRDGKNEKAESGTYTYDSFTSMDISNGVADLVIQTGDCYKVETKDVPESLKVGVKDNGTLQIKWKKHEWFDWFVWFDHNSWNKNSKIYITVPEGYEAKKVTIDSGTGNIKMDGIVIDNFVLDGGVGNIEGSKITADKVDIDAGVGDVTFNSVDFTDCDVDCGVGDIKLNGKITGNNEFDAGVGDLDLTIQGNKSDYEFDVDKGVGSIRIDGDKVDNMESNENATNRIEVDGGVGDITINFNK